MDKEKRTTFTLPIKLVCLCTECYGTNTSKAILNCLADYLLLPAEEQKLDRFGMHQVIPNVDDREKMGKFSIRIPENLFSIIKDLSGKDTISETVAKMLCNALHFNKKNASNIQCKPMLYVLGNKTNAKMQDAIRHIKETALVSKFAISIETCAGALGIYSSFQFASKTILNDLDWDKANLYRAIQENPRKLIVLTRTFKVDKNTFEEQKKRYKTFKKSKEINYEAAACYLFLNACQDGYWEGLYYSKMTVEKYISKLENILPLHKQLSSNDKQIITHDDAINVIKKYRHNKNVLFIVDPPYHDADYYNSAKNKFNDKKHKELANELRLAKHNHDNHFLYFCRITATSKHKGEDRPDHDRHMKGRIDDLFYGNGFYFIDVPLEDNDGTIERIITSFDFEGAKPYGKGVS